MKLRMMAVLAVLPLALTIGGATAGSSASAVKYGASGWEGYTFRASSRVSADFTVPRVSGTNGQAVAFWVGFGQGNPHIQQVGVTATVTTHGVAYSAWMEDWPASAHGFGKTVKAGDLLQLIVTRSGSTYRYLVNDETQHWSASATTQDATREASGEAMSEAFGPDLPRWTAATFRYTYEPLQGTYTMGHGITLHKINASAFTITR